MPFCTSRRSGVNFINGRASNHTYTNTHPHTHTHITHPHTHAHIHIHTHTYTTAQPFFLISFLCPLIVTIRHREADKQTHTHTQTKANVVWAQQQMQSLSIKKDTEWIVNITPLTSSMCPHVILLSSAPAHFHLKARTLTLITLLPCDAFILYLTSSIKSNESNSFCVVPNIVLLHKQMVGILLRPRWRALAWEHEVGKPFRL